MCSWKRFTIRFSMVVCGASMLFFGLRVVAAQAPPERQEKLAPWETRVTFDFPGGTLKEYVGSVAPLSDGFNVIVDPAIADEHVAPVQANRMPAYDAVAILEQLMAISIETVGTEGTVIVTRRGGGGFGGGQPRGRVTHVISVRDLLEIPSDDSNEKRGTRYSLDDVISAIEAALDIDSAPGSKRRTNIKLHKETGLLLIEGAVQDVEIVNEVIEQLRLGQQSLAQQNEKNSAAMFQKEQELARLQAVIRERELQLQQMQVQLNHLELRREIERAKGAGQ